MHCIAILHSVYLTLLQMLPVDKPKLHRAIGSWVQKRIIHLSSSVKQINTLLCIPVPMHCNILHPNDSALNVTQAFYSSCILKSLPTLYVSNRPNRHIALQASSIFDIQASKPMHYVAFCIQVPQPLTSHSSVNALHRFAS